MRPGWRLAFFPEEPAACRPEGASAPLPSDEPVIRPQPSPQSDRPTAAHSEVTTTVVGITGPLIRVHRSAEFKRAAVKLVYARGSITAAGRELGVPFSTLHKWVDADRQERASANAKHAEGKGTGEQVEIARLQAELAKVTLERDMLKRATAFFAQFS